MDKKNYLPWLIARFFIGGIFIFAGFLKLSQPVEVFRGMIATYGVIPYFWIGPVAHISPWIEFIAGTFLVLGYFPRGAAVVLGALCLSFIGLIGWSKLNGTLPANCGCFGEGIHMTPYQMVILDFLNVLLAYRLFQIKKHLWCVAS